MRKLQQLATNTLHIAKVSREAAVKAGRTEQSYASAELKIDSTASIDWLHVLPIGDGSRAAATQLSWQVLQRQLGA
jgi:hypothetical protein